MTSYEAFAGLALEHNVIPLVRTLLADTLTPVSTYLTLREEGTPSFLLESVEPDEKIGRYSFVGIAPTMMIHARGERVTIRQNGSVSEMHGDIFQVLRGLTSTFRQAEHRGVQALTGGFVGFVGYDAVRSLEKIPIPPPALNDEDDAVFGLFPTVVQFDHRNQLVTLIHNVMVDSSTPLNDQYERGKKVLEALELRLKRPAVSASTFKYSSNGIPDGHDRDRFCHAVRRAKEHIVEGDIFQAVLSRRVERKYSGDLFAAYRALRIINPSPYLFFIDFGDTKLAGSSPEVLVRSRNGIVETLPIAGTRPRGADEMEDARLEADLLNDTKELAEHVMLVDLGRNDVGRICEYGSVSVPVFKRVERYSHVMHIVSEVRGVLRKGQSPVDVLAACFPAGTVSGAPKVRAMEIIHQLEGSGRGAYAGAVGYVGFDGTLDTCITIRTIVARGDTLKIQAGAGIVADSVPEKEYEETLNKSRALLQALDVAANGFPASHFSASLAERRP